MPIISKISITLLLLTLSSNIGFCQDGSAEFVKLDILDVHILEFRIVNKVNSNRYNNCLPKRSKTKKGLYKIVVENVIHNSNPSGVTDSDLLGLEYVLIDESLFQSKFIGSFYSIGSKRFLILNQYLDLNIDKVFDYDQHAFVTIDCKYKERVIKAIEKFERK